jgi:hypothetical protein
MKISMINPFFYFVSGLPPGSLFKMTFDDLKELVDKSKEMPEYNPTVEVCLIGLVAQFEAFCKNIFAAIINISPFLLNNLLSRRPELSINVRDLLEFKLFSINGIGFLISEKFDFGSAKAINNIFNDLLSISPFSSNEIEKYNKLLNNRNLLVHHAGIYTLRYHRSSPAKKFFKKRVFYDSLILKKRDYKIWANFIEKIVIKIIETCYNKLNDYIKSNKIKLSREKKKAIEFLKWYKIEKEYKSELKKYYDQ